MRKRFLRLWAAAAAPALLLAGCGKAAEELAERAIEAETGGEADFDAEGGTFTFTDPQTGETTTTTLSEQAMTVTDAQGNETLSLGEGAKLPAGWPGDAPLPDGLTLTAALTEGDTFTVSGDASGPAAQVYAQAKERLIAEGWSVGQESVAGQTHAVNLVKDGRETHMFVVDTGEGTMVTITASR